MLLENYPYPQDIRVRAEAETLVAAGYRVTVVAPKSAEQSRTETVNGVEVWRFPLTPDRPGLLYLLVEYAVAHVYLFWYFARLVRRGAHVIHVHNPPDFLALAIWVARQVGRRTVFDNHDLTPDLFALRFGENLIFRVLRAIQKRAYVWADLVITTNESQRLVATRARGRSDLTVVVRNAPPRRMLADPAAPASAPLIGDVAPRRSQVVYLGLLGPQDGGASLPEILYRLRRIHGIDAELLVIGDGSERHAVETRATQLGVGGYLTVTGRLPHADVPDRLREADVCVDPSPSNPFNDRCTMMKISEYLAAAKPVVSFPLLETVRTAGDTIVYARANDVADMAAQIARLLLDPAARQELSVRARRRADALLWELSAQELLGAYQALLSADHNLSVSTRDWQGDGVRDRGRPRT